MTDVALVTGAAGALGGQVARTLSARGDRLVLVDGGSAKARLEQLASTMKGACVVAGDITDDKTWIEAMPRIERELGSPPSLAALIAGGFRGGAPLHEEKDSGVWTAMMNANLETVHKSLVRLLPPMVAKQRGSIVVVGSRAAVQPWTSAGAAAYATSKAAVVALAQAVAAEVLEHRVRVNAVMPSTMDTPANRAAMPKADPSRWVSLDSAAGVVAFLLSDAARDISGAALPLYGCA
jgi:NAD(P)-dependent dehydrogenase (short-subunit alcohol dehydrogenase family)